jgi:membrane protease YdiL (CAAX protease family)
MNSQGNLMPEGFSSLGPGRKFPVLPFFVLVFSSWVVWIPAGARMAGKLPFYFPTEIAWLGIFSPMIFGTYFIYRFGGKPGLKLHFARFVKWRFAPRMWAFALLAMPLTGLMTALAYSLTFEPIMADGWSRLYNGDLMRNALIRYNENAYESIGLISSINAWMGMSALTFAIGWITLGFIDGGISEEPGWRGFAYPILQDRWGALPAALLVGLVWAAWHLGPRQWAILFGQGADAFVAFLPGYAAMYVIGVTPLAVIFAWLYQNTKGSLLAVFILHNSFNQTSLAVSSLFPRTPVMLGIVAFLWLMVAYILFTRGWRSFGPPEQPSQLRSGVRVT